MQIKNSFQKTRDKFLRPSSYWQYQVWNRRKKLISRRLSILGVLAGLAVAFGLPRIASQGISSSNVASAIMTFASIAFGACLTGAVLALTLPSDKLRKELSEHHTPKDSKFSDFSDLVFVFTWSAISQLPLILGGIFLLFVGGNFFTGHSHPREIWFRSCLGLITFFGVNALAQLIAVVKAISSMAGVAPLLEVKSSAAVEKRESPD